MDDSSINPILLSSSAHLENVEQLIKNLEKQTLDMDNFEDILSNRHRQDIITKSFSSVLSSTMAMSDLPDDNFLLKSISLTNPDGARKPSLNDETLSMDSLFNQRDLFESDDLKKQRTPPGIDQSLSIDQDGGFTWDDQYDTRANYRLTFSTDKPPQAESKKDKHQRHKHHHHRHHHHRHRHRSTDSPSNSMNSDEGFTGNNMNDWSMRSSFNAAEQRDQKPPASAVSTTVNTQQAAFIRSQSHPASFSPQQQLPNNTHSPNSSTTSSSSSASWKRMKDSQRTTSGIEAKEARPPSPLSLYKIFQQKSQMAASSSSNPRSAFQYYRQQTDSIVPNQTDSMTISGERMLTDKPRSSQQQRRPPQAERSSSQTNTSNDQAIQTSILLDSSSNSPMNGRRQPTPSKTKKSDSYDQLSARTDAQSPHHLSSAARPSSASISSSAIHKSLPDLAFISQYSKEIPRSRTTSPSLPPTSVPSATSSSMNSANTTVSPTITEQQKQDSDRPRTLKSIKLYKNDRHSTEPLGVFYSPQLRKTFAAVPASAVINGSNDAPTVIKMRLPPPSSFPSKHQQQQASNLKSCLKYGSRANSCDIQAMLQDRRSPAPALIIPEPPSNKTSISSSGKRRSSEADAPPTRPDALHPSNMHTTGSSNDLNSYVLQDPSEEHQSDYDFNSFQQSQAKKSVSFSENIAKHLISPCNPAIQFDPTPEALPDNDLLKVFGGSKENSSRKVTSRYGEMRRCQTDVIVVNRIQHLHSFTESPPNEFRFQDTDSLAPEPEDEDDQTIMNKTHVNILPNPEEPIPAAAAAAAEHLDLTIEKMTSSNDKENKTPEQSIVMNASTTTLIPTNDPTLDGLLERVSNMVKRIFEIKRSEKAFFLTNENNTQLDTLLKNDLCPFVQDILQHGLKPQRKDLSLAKQSTIWKVIETSIDSGQSLQVFHDAKQIGQKTSSYWLYQFQGFIFALLNKNELINWLYHFMKQKDILSRFYQSPDALILVSTSATFNLVDRLMVQLEKLSPLAFRLVYKPLALPSNIEEQLTASTISSQSTKSSARDWMMRRTSRTSTQPISHINQTSTASAIPAADTIRSTLSRKINSLFTKTNTTQPPRKTSSAVTAKLPPAKPQSTRLPSPAPTVTRRTGVSNVFANATAAAATTNKPVIVSSPKLNHATRTGTMRRGISPSVVVAPSPPPILNSTGTIPSTTATAFQSKIPRPSLNVDKPKSARYRSTAPPPK